MTPFIDANVWLHLANVASPCHAKVKSILQPFLKEKRFAVSWQIFYEFIRVGTDPRAFESPFRPGQAFDFMKRLFQHPHVVLLQEGPSHSEALQFSMEKSGFQRGQFIHDCHIAALLHENGIKTIITADQDFRRFPFLEILDPTS